MVAVLLYAVASLLIGYAAFFHELGAANTYDSVLHKDNWSYAENVWGAFFTGVVFVFTWPVILFFWLLTCFWYEEDNLGV